MGMARAESQAAAWLAAHRGAAPNQDELSELKATNPTAYAIVKALLTKRSLGLLDPKHPSASFAPAGGGQAAAAQEDVPSGPAAYERIAEESGVKPNVEVSLAYPDAPVAPVHHDWLSWKPSQSAMDDDAMVKNVLGAVAELKSGKTAPTSLRGQSQASQGSDDPLQWQDNSAAASVAPVAAAAFAAPEEKPKAAMSQENSYLKGIDFGLGSQSAESAPPQRSDDNSYLKGFSFGSDVRAVASPAEPAASSRMSQLGVHAAAGKSDSHDLLASFSWDDDNTRKPAPQTVEASPAGGAGSEVPKAQAAKPRNALLAWLGGGAPAAPAAAAAPKLVQAAAAPQSGYMMDLQ